MADKIFPVALQIWLIFLFAFLLMGYAVIPSILFGAIGGFASGMIAAWWQTPGGELKQDPEPTAIEKIGGRLRPGWIQSRMPFIKIFTRRDRRYPGSRRM